ncbi:hypothetical protein BGZ68_005471 [Mortierella alpina]|nr:hypothetical protein BGZ68_005471 [Mortierella alpina]
MSLDITMGAPGEDQESVREQRQEQSRALYTQLARSKQLQYLSLQPAQTCRHSSNMEPFCLRLEMGVDLLAAQTQLEVINLYKNQQMDRNDVLWMVEHLKNLRMISGGLLNDKQVGKRAFKDKYLWDYELAKILNSHRIETPASVYDDGYLDDVQHLLGTGWPGAGRDDLVYVEEEHETLEETDQVAPEVQTVGWAAAAEWAVWSETGATEWSM